MKHIWTILIEFALLGFLAFLYYLFQKGRILKKDKIEIFETLEEMTKYMQEHVNTISDQRLKEEIETYTKSLIQNNNDQNYLQLSELLRNAPNSLPEIFINAMPSLDDQIRFHIK